MSDDLTGVFDDLTPADFDKSSVRYMESTTTGWTEWVKENLRATRVSWLASDGLMNPIAIMRNKGNSTLMFTPDDDETMRQFIARLAREAKKHDAIWFFTTLITEGGQYMGPAHAVDEEEAISAAREQGELKPCVYFFTERRNDPNFINAIRHGIIPINDGHLGEVFEAPPEHASPIYQQVLP